MITAVEARKCQEEMNASDITSELYMLDRQIKEAIKVGDNFTVVDTKTLKGTRINKFLLTIKNLGYEVEYGNNFDYIVRW